MQIIIHVVSRNIFIWSNSRWQSVFHMPSYIYSAAVQCGSDHSLFQTPHVHLSCGGTFSCISVQDVADLLGILGICASCSHMRSTLTRNFFEA